MKFSMKILFILLMLVSISEAAFGKKFQCQELLEELEFFEANNVSLTYKKNRIKPLLNNTITNFINSFKQSELKVSVQKLASDPMNETLFAQLKSQRKDAAIVRSLMILVSKKKDVPPSFKRLVRSWGRFHDAIEYHQLNPSEKGGIKSIEGAAKYFIKMIKKSEIAAELSNVKISKSKQIRNDYLKQIDFIEGYLRKDEINGKEFHEIRKGLKNFLSVMKIFLRNDNAKFSSIVDYMEAVNLKLGFVTDEIAYMHVKGTNPISIKLRLPSNVKDPLFDFLGKMRSSLD